MADEEDPVLLEHPAEHLCELDAVLSHTIDRDRRRD
jgi:hypothetical protein